MTITGANYFPAIGQAVFAYPTFVINLASDSLHRTMRLSVLVKEHYSGTANRKVAEKCPFLHGQIAVTFAVNVWQSTKVDRFIHRQPEIDEAKLAIVRVDAVNYDLPITGQFID